MNTLDALDAESLRSDIPEFRPGDTLKVHVRVIEGSRERVQVFQGAVIRRQGSGLRETFTVRKVSFGVGGAIIAMSDSAAEFDETMIKASAITGLLGTTFRRNSALL